MPSSEAGPSWNAVEQWTAGDQIQGGRDYQEDEFAITLLTGDSEAGDRLLLVLADGMGGHAGGKVASETVVQAFWDGFRQLAADIAANLKVGVRAANEAVRARQQADPALFEMGSTLVAALVRDGHLYWASVGDSLLWVFRNGRLTRLNADHSMRPLLLGLVEIGRMTEEEVRHDSRVHQLRSAIMGEDIPLVDITAVGYPLKSDDVVLLASDGLETLSEAELEALLTRHGTDARVLVRALLEAVSEADVAHQDNTTALVYRVGDDRHCLHITLDQMEAPTKQANAKLLPHNIHIYAGSLSQSTQPTPETQLTQPTPKTPSLWTKIRTYMSGTER